MENTENFIKKGDTINREDTIKELEQRLPEGNWELLTIRNSDNNIVKVMIKRVIRIE